MSKPNGKWSCEHSWTQAYPGWPKEQSDHSTQKEMDRIASIDKLVDSMLTYPEAEAIINNIKKRC